MKAMLAFKNEAALKMPSLYDIEIFAEEPEELTQ